MGNRTLPAPDLSPVDLTDHDVFVEDVPHEWFAWLRRHEPVSFTPEPNGRGFWSVTRHADIVEVSRDWRTYSSQTGATALEDLEPDALQARLSMLDADPPLHTELRRTVNHPFTRRAVAGYEQQVREVVVDVLDEALERDEFDFVEQIAVRVPIRVLCRILGVPAGDEPLIVELSDKLIANTDPELTDVLFGGADSDDYRLLPFRNPAARDVHAYGRDLAAAKRAAPDTSLVSHLINGRDGREPLQGRDFDAMFLLLAVAGNETTRSGLSLGLDALIDHPDQWKRLRDDRSEVFLNTATEELLRYTTPLHHFRRTATRDTELGGRQIAAGEKVVVWYPSGNRDETVFAQPHRLDLARTPNPHLAFGRGGPHRCLGEHLALLEIRIVLEELLARVTGFERTGPARRVRSNFVNGLKTLPVIVTGRP